ncbi:MAG: tryptophan-rich sensory protein [Clostridia bacterium]|nr:tryptophan-rich sensory protein [Clostridia bacterium]MBQ5794162.1 tryptophan-rich sensory protein [Clostridia bacterium]
MRKDNTGILSCALIVGGVLVLLGMGVRLWWGAPNAGITQMGIRHLLPPVWVMGLLWTLWYFALGTTLGAVLCAYGSTCIAAWRGAFFFLLMLFAGYLWYPLFFVRQAPLLSFLVLLAVLSCAVLCALQWQKVSFAAAAVLWAHVLWLLYMLILQLVCIFNV